MKKLVRASVRRLIEISTFGMLFGISSAANAGPISFDTWYEFSFGEVGTLAAGCFPEDPAGGFCIASGGTPTSNLDAAPWTFTAGADGATLTIVDAFLSGDRFELFDFGTSLGFTSVPGAEGDCGDDPLTCLADSNMSQVVASLGAGLHSITLVAALSPLGGGAGYLLAKDGGGISTSVPEPSTWALLGIGLFGIGFARRGVLARSAT
jgi:hypothetical protein